ncbi:MAG TPA: MFS transporter [Thermomicrobiales bacterium]|nr:MFS transporter [Thermomicrobiales bacterium]
MSTHPNKRGTIRNVVIVSSGNFLEMYDFMVFGYYASAIGHAFFPASSEFASLMLSLATFGAGFLMRPLGALVLGAYVDRHGRRAGLLLTLALMAIGTVSIACVPGYATIGLAAPVIVLVGRLMQGLSAGAQIGGVSVYLAEIATPGRRGFYVSWQSASQQVAVTFAALVGLAATTLLTPPQMLAWGWRIPIGLGCLLIPFLFLIRSYMEESEEFLAQAERPTASAVFRSIAINWRVVVLGTLLATMTTVSFYLITAYTPTFGSTVLHLKPSDAMAVTLCVGVCNFVLLPTMGALSDKIGRRPLLIGCTLVALATAYPSLSWLVADPSFARLLIVEIWLAIVYATYNAAMIVHLTEVMPPRVRATAFSLAYSTATAIFGGFTPAICTYLIHVTGNRATPGLWLSAAALCGLTAAIALGADRKVLQAHHSPTGGAVLKQAAK